KSGDVMAERLVFVYKSQKKQGRYLYLKEKDVFSHIPSGLLDAFGAPQFVMMFALSKHRNLPKVKVEDLEKALDEKGYFLRIDLDDMSENLINEERKFRGLVPLSKEELSDLFK
ncbi:MAG: YcgL domain-containing protein, partial [Succinivibrio sp.]